VPHLPPIDLAVDPLRWASPVYQAAERDKQRLSWDAQRVAQQAQAALGSGSGLDAALQAVRHQLQLLGDAVPWSDRAHASHRGWEELLRMLRVFEQRLERALNPPGPGGTTIWSRSGDYLEGFTANGRAAMEASPGYFLWWYTAKSCGLVIALVAGAYLLGREHGRR
jgi:hypothetical protein